MKKHKLDKKYFLSCEECHRLHRKCVPEVERPCGECLRKGRQCVPRQRSKKAKKGSNKEDTIQNLQKELTKMKRENELLKKKLSEKQRNEIVTSANSSNKMESLWMVLSRSKPKEEEQISLKQVKIVRMSQSLQDLLGRKINLNEEAKIEEFVAGWDPKIKPNNYQVLYEKHRTLEYEIISKQIPLYRSNGEILGMNFTSTNFYDENCAVYFCQMNSFWPIKDLSEAQRIMKDKTAFIITSKLRSKAESSLPLLSFDFDLMEEKELFNLFSQEKNNSSHVFEFDFEKNSLY